MSSLVAGQRRSSDDCLSEPVGSGCHDGGGRGRGFVARGNSVIHVRRVADTHVRGVRNGPLQILPQSGRLGQTTGGRHVAACERHHVAGRRSQVVRRGGARSNANGNGDSAIRHGWMASATGSDSKQRDESQEPEDGRSPPLGRARFHVHPGHITAWEEMSA